MSAMRLPFLWVALWLAVADAKGRSISSRYNGTHLVIEVVSESSTVALESTPVAVHVNSRWYSAAGPSPSLVLKSVKTSNGSDELGDYRRVEATWEAGETPFITAVQDYTNMEYVVVETAYPEGAQGVQSDPYNEHNAVVANFPSLDTHPLPGVLSWEDNFLLPAIGRKTLGPSGGPTVFYDAAMANGTGPLVLVSPVDWFKATSESAVTYDGKDAFVPGTAATFRELPKGFRHRFMFFTGTGGGITETMYQWGKVMQGMYMTEKVPDPTLEKLSYQTDNGAQYCFCFEDCNNKLLAVKAGLDTQGVQLGFMSFQGAWWDNQYIHTPHCAPWCVSDWETNTTKYPMDTAEFQHVLGLPLQLYAPYFCKDSKYAKVNGGEWNMMASNGSLPGCGPSQFLNARPEDSKAFYTWFFAKYKDRYSMISYEPDFLQQNYQCTPEFLADVHASPMWQKGMADAALEANLPLQWCMATPTDLLQSLQFPSVTNFRASTDYYYGSSWDIGVSSLLVWALGAVPSKDTFWTTENQGSRTNLGGCPVTGCPPDHSGPGSELHTILAVMATGPVGFSDAVGMTNGDLIKRTCMADGTLLKPSKPITTLDIGLSLVNRPNGHILGSYSGRGGSVWGWYVLAHQMKEGYDVLRSHLWPPLPSGEVVRVMQWGTLCQNGSSADTCATSRGSDLLLHAPGTPEGGDPYRPMLFVIGRACPSGWTFLGEPAKFATLSANRFASVSCTAAGMVVTLVGSPSESVGLIFLSPQHTVATHLVSFTNSRRATVTVG